MPSPDRDLKINTTNSYHSDTRRNSDGQFLFSSDASLELSRLSSDFLKTISVRTPNYSKLKRSQLPVNSYSKEYNVFSSPKGHVKTNDRGAVNNTTYLYSTNYAYMVTPLRGAQADDPAQRAINRLMEQVKLARADAWTSMAEFHKTAAHVAHTATRVYKAISALKKGRFGDFTSALGVSYTSRESQLFSKRYKYRFKTKRTSTNSRFTDFLSDTWLEYQYGWKPLLMDTYNLAEASAKAMVDHGGGNRTVRARAHTVRGDDRVAFSNQFRKELHAKSERWIEYGITYSIPSGVSFADAFGLNNPMQMAWEIIPFSFVADWFLPIGDAISALTAYSGLSFKKGYVSRRDTYEDINLLKPGGAYSAGGVTYQCLSSDLSQTQFELMITRQPLYDWPSYGWPTAKMPGSWQQAASAIALLQSLFLRK
jgi:hypothetical protein